MGSIRIQVWHILIVLFLLIIGITYLSTYIGMEQWVIGFVGLMIVAFLWKAFKNSDLPVAYLILVVGIVMMRYEINFIYSIFMFVVSVLLLVTRPIRLLETIKFKQRMSNEITALPISFKESDDKKKIRAQKTEEIKQCFVRRGIPTCLHKIILSYCQLKTKFDIGDDLYCLLDDDYRSAISLTNPHEGIYYRFDINPNFISNIVFEGKPCIMRFEFSIEKIEDLNINGRSFVTFCLSKEENYRVKCLINFARYMFSAKDYIKNHNKNYAKGDNTKKINDNNGDNNNNNNNNNDNDTPPHEDFKFLKYEYDEYVTPFFPRRNELKMKAYGIIKSLEPHQKIKRDAKKVIIKIEGVNFMKDESNIVYSLELE